MAATILINTLYYRQTHDLILINTLNYRQTDDLSSCYCLIFYPLETPEPYIKGTFSTKTLHVIYIVSNQLRSESYIERKRRKGN